VKKENLRESAKSAGEKKSVGATRQGSDLLFRNIKLIQIKENLREKKNLLSSLNAKN
jgi:hypothetical protein